MSFNQFLTLSSTIFSCDLIWKHLISYVALQVQSFRIYFIQLIFFVFVVFIDFYKNCKFMQKKKKRYEILKVLLNLYLLYSQSYICLFYRFVAKMHLSIVCISSSNLFSVCISNNLFIIYSSIHSSYIPNTLFGKFFSV